MAAGARARYVCYVPATDLATSRARCATADVRRRSQQTPYAVSGAPTRPDRADVDLAIDRWNNEGGFVYDDGLGRRLRRRSSGLNS
jgi:hypothetical protein